LGKAYTYLRGSGMLLRRLAAFQFPGRALATKAEKALRAKKLEEKRKKTAVSLYKGHWTYEHYLKYKDPNTSYQDKESDEWNLTSSMAIERTPRLQRFEAFWEAEWFQFTDSLDLKKKKVVPLDWLQTQKQADEDVATVFRPNPRITEEDRIDNRRPLHRALDRSAFLLLKIKGKGWRFPEGPWKKEETIRETAENCSKQLCGPELATYLLGNAPVAHTEDVETKQKWFLMHNLYLGGNVVLSNPEVQDFAWVTKEEFHQYFSDVNFVAMLHKVFYMP